MTLHKHRQAGLALFEILIITLALAIMIGGPVIMHHRDKNVRKELYKEIRVVERLTVSDFSDRAAYQVLTNARSETKAAQIDLVSLWNNRLHMGLIEKSDQPVATTKRDLKDDGESLSSWRKDLEKSKDEKSAPWVQAILKQEGLSLKEGLLKSDISPDKLDQLAYHLDQQFYELTREDKEILIKLSNSPLALKLKELDKRTADLLLAGFVENSGFKKDRVEDILSQMKYR